MTALMIVTAKIHDREKFVTGYGAAAAKLVAQFGGKYLIRAPGAQQLEGEGLDGTSVVVSEWPDKAAALRFWNSPELLKPRRCGRGWPTFRCCSWKRRAKLAMVGIAWTRELCLIHRQSRPSVAAQMGIAENFVKYTSRRSLPAPAR
jgi:uncharacterized protein (DUF1330 family)